MPRATSGVRFDSNYNGPGLLVAQVIPGSPAWLEKSKLQSGDKVLSINGERVDPGTDLTAILNGSINKETLSESKEKTRRLNL